MFDLDGELADLKRAVAHMDMGLKAIRLEMRTGTDHKRLLEPMRDQIQRIKSIAERAGNKIEEELGHVTREPIGDVTAAGTEP